MTTSGVFAGEWTEATGEQVEVVNPTTGEALARVTMASAQDYDRVADSSVETFLRWRSLPAPKRGYVHTINAGMIARGVQVLAQTKKGKPDPAVGVSEIKKIGTQVKQGEPLMMIHYNDEAKLEKALEYFKNAYRLAPKRPTPPPLIVERVA